MCNGTQRTHRPGLIGWQESKANNITSFKATIYIKTAPSPKYSALKEIVKLER